MKKLLLVIVLVLISAYAGAQDSLKHNPIVGSVSLSSKNFWRGNVYGNNAPSISGTLGYRFKNNLELGATGTSPFSGNRDGYGIWMELYASKTFEKIEGLTLVVDDYYFFNAEDSLNDYGSWNHNTTQHIVEGRIKYEVNRFNVMFSYVLYAAKGLDNAPYVEAEYFLVPQRFSVSLGGVFGASALNFYDAPGITHAGVTGYGNVRLTESFSVPLRLSVFASPNYKNASKYPKFSQNLINFVVAISF
jgi:hypothetical protein